MRTFTVIAAALLASTSHTAWAADGEDDAGSAGGADAPAAAAPAAPAAKAFSTGVAKGRDLLDTAISASVIDETDLAKLSVSSVSGIMQNIPGIRSQTADVDGYASITVRGLPMASDGSKFLQIQEDGLPVLEFGDFNFGSVDRFVRADLSLSQIQSIRGGSASTFASNSPGGVVNLISKTGEVEGGALQVSSGLGHDLKRVDFDYGSPLGEGWRFHIGGFYREGEGPRDLGYTAFRGGQVKFNVTRSFAGGYIRLYAKYLDDRQPNYGQYPARVTGTNADPVFADLPGTTFNRDSLGTPLTTRYLGVDANNLPTSRDGADGMHAVVKSAGLEAQFEVAGWSVTDRFRYADISGSMNLIDSMIVAPPPVLATILGGPGATLSYAAGPNAGQAIGPGSTINGNGLVNLNLLVNLEQDSLDNVTNDLRASRVFELGGGKLTASFGVYNSRQDLSEDWNFTNMITDLAGDGRIAPVDLRAADGTLLTQRGVYSYGFGFALPRAGGNLNYDMQYRITAPYGSLNFAVGKLSVGGSLRYDRGSVKGRVYNTGIVGPVDVDGDGVLVPIEQQVPLLPLAAPVMADYTYNYLSYSTGVNYRFAETLSAFARYSRGGRASADRVLSATSLSSVTGKLTSPELAFGTVKQAEGGIKYRQGALALYVTGFWASTAERNSQIGADSNGNVVVLNLVRRYSAKGVELEGEYKRGPFALALGGTWTKARIDGDATNPALAGNRPRYIPEFSFIARPSLDLGVASLGAVINGTASSFAQDVNQLKLPGYVLVSPFVQVRPAERVTLGLNVFNAFDKRAIFTASSAAIPASGIVNVSAMNGRTVTASLRYSF